MRNGVALVVAIVLGVFGFAGMEVVMKRHADQIRGSFDKPQEMTRIVVAAEALPAGTLLEPGHLAEMTIPSDYVSSQHVEESQRTWLLQKTLRVGLAKGDPLLRAAVNVERGAAAADLDSQLSPMDCRAASIECKPGECVAGLIRPGHRVDVVATFDVNLKHIVPPGEKASGETVTKTVCILKNRRVLAVDVRTVSKYDGDPKTTTAHVVTLALTPEEVVKLGAVMHRGQPYLAVRHSADNHTAETAPLDADILLLQKAVQR